MINYNLINLREKADLRLACTWVHSLFITPVTWKFYILVKVPGKIKEKEAELSSPQNICNPSDLHIQNT